MQACTALVLLVTLFCVNVCDILILILILIYLLTAVGLTPGGSSKGHPATGRGGPRGSG